jgi:hypothetical protein
MTRVVLQALFFIFSLIALSVALVFTFNKTIGSVIPENISVKADVQASNSDASAILPLASKALADFPQTMALPLFYEGRNFPKTDNTALAPPPPMPQPEIIPAAPGPGIEQLKLLGVHLVGERKAALISVADSASKWYGERESVAGWSVQFVRPNEVILSRGSDTAKIILYRGQSKD